MRITGSRLLTLAAQATTRAQGVVAERAGELSSGRRIDRPSDDTVAWTQARRAAVRQAESVGRGEGLGRGRDHLANAERALGTLGDLFASARQLAVQAANASYGPTERAALGVDAAAKFGAALAAANTRDASGEYVFAGSLGGAAPFDAAGNYVGDALARSIELDDTNLAAVTVAGSSLTAASGIDVLPALGRLAAALAANNQPAIELAVEELDVAHQQLNRARVQVGTMMGVIDEADRSRLELQDALATQISNLVDTDVVEGASALVRSTTALDAAKAINSKLAVLLAPR